MKNICASDFWKWAYSDFMSNALRGVLAEYIVARASNCTHRSRKEWDAYDLETESGLKIEVKSAAYLQTWEQKRHSIIRFDIASKKAWYFQTNQSAKEALRSADLYVFCIFATKDKKFADPLNPNQWFFLMCPTSTLSKHFGTQRSVSLSALEAIGLERLDFDALGTKISSTEADYSMRQHRVI